MLPSHFSLLLFLITHATLKSASADAGCPFASLGDLKGLEHSVSGTVSISEDCKLTAKEFNYDGQAPQVYWWAGPSCNVADIKKEGQRISDVQIEKSYSDGELTVPLLPNIDWSSVGCVTVYCEEFFADLGHVEIKEKLSAPVSSGYTSPEPANPPKAAPTTVEDLPKCEELIPGYLNVHWEIQGDTIVLGLEGRPGEEPNRWMGFGFSPEGSAGPQMVGSDVIVAGMVGSKCFAYNYHLSDREQCDFVTGQGVCPSFAGQKPLNPASSTVELLACDKVGDKLSVLLSRPLGNSEGKENAWPTDGSRYAVFAMGPVSEGSNNASIPIVLYHQLQLPGTTAPASINAAGQKPVKLNLSGIENNCRPIVPLLPPPPSSLLSSTLPAPTAAPAPLGGNVATIDGEFEFLVTIGSNKNYPNPPAWGYSLWVNGLESPVLTVRRGTKYTFKAAAGPTHPIYITNSIIGGGLIQDYADETVFAGNDTTVGTPDSPVTFSWTPDRNTPDLVYYQCVVHQKLGWQIKVLDAGVPSTAIAPAPAPAPKSISACTIRINGETLSYETCFPVENIGQGYFISWNLTENSDGLKMLSIGMNATAQNPRSYVALGFPENPGQMVGASAMVLSACPNCPTGAQLVEYSLNGQVASAVEPEDRLGAQNIAANAENGKIYGKFEVVLPMNAVKKRRRALLMPTLTSPTANFPMLFSAGVTDSSGKVQQHIEYGSSFVNYDAALTKSEDAGDSSSSATPPVISSTTINNTARTAHMWLMPIGFGILIPLGVLVAHMWPPPKSKTGFNLHRALQTFGFAVGASGLAAGFVAAGGWTSTYSIHRNIGVSVLVLCFVQILALLPCLRPKLDAKIRQSWAIGHRWLGRATTVLAIANIYYGIIHVGKLGTWAWATYTAILGVIVMVGLGKDLMDCTAGGSGDKKVDISNSALKEKESSYN